MLQNVNLDAVKQYNASLKQYKDKAATLNAEIEYTNKEIDSLCAELTTELGVTVTRDNIEQIYNEQVAKINSTLQSGNAVLAKIASEEQASVTPNANTQPVQQTMPMQSSIPAQPVMSNVQTPMGVAQPVSPAAMPGSVFNGQSNPLPGQQFNGELPPLFGV